MSAADAAGTTADAETVRVGLGARSYDVLVGRGLLETAGAAIAPVLARPQTVVVTDETVWAAQGPRLAAGLAAADIAFETIVLPPGEATKSFAQLERLVAALLERGVERADAIVAFGGGVVGDLAGFASAILRRGCRFVQIPTTLLAQVDSAVGGKTGINTALGKNLVGAFHQPALVLADVDALDTLDPRELRAGYAEVLKYGALGDAAFFAWLEENAAAVLAGDAAARIYAVRRSVAMKAAIVAEDEREAGKRALLNLGHTFGHALEAAYGYDGRLLHGEAVAAGMAFAAGFSAEIGWCDAAVPQRMTAALRAAGLPAGFADLADPPSPATMTALMAHDKKTAGGVLSLILMRDIGDAGIRKTPDLAPLEAFLARERTAAAR